MTIQTYLIKVVVFASLCFHVLNAEDHPTRELGADASSAGDEDPADHVAHASSEHTHITQAVAVYVGPVTGVVMFGIVVAGVMHNPCMPHWFHSIPESLIFIVVGVLFTLFGVWLFEWDAAERQENVDFFTELNSVLLNLVLLPVIIFESGWSLRHHDFFHQLPWIIIFAVGGTLISFFIVGSLIVWTGTLGLHCITDWRVALAYSALISAVDPVASLATYASLHVEPLLNISVFGESTINDAVAIALFSVFNDSEFMDKAENGKKTLATAIKLEVTGQVCWKLFGSMFIGVAVGFMVVLIFRITEMNHSPSLECLLVFTSAFFMFCCAENPYMHASGIIACLFGGIFLGIFARPHLSVEGSYLASYFIKQCSCLADMVVFITVGCAVFTMQFESGNGLALGALVSLFCIIARFAALFPLGWLVNLLKKFFRGQKALTISNGRLFMMFWAGLRGGIAAVLTLELGPWVDETSGSGTKSSLFICTFIVIVFFLLVMGSSTECMLQYFKIPMGSGVDQSELAGSRTFEVTYGCTNRFLTALLIGQERSAEYEEQASKIQTDDVYAALTSRAWGTKKVALHHHRRFWDHTDDVRAGGDAICDCFDDDEEREYEYELAAPMHTSYKPGTIVYAAAPTAMYAAAPRTVY